MSGYSLFRDIREQGETVARHLVQIPNVYVHNAQRETQLPDGGGMFQMLSGESEIQ
jgi:hypothetical protein